MTDDPRHTYGSAYGSAYSTYGSAYGSAYSSRYTSKPTYHSSYYEDQTHRVKVAKETLSFAEAEAEADKERKRHTVLGLAGLANLGNTCYFNAIIQCLNSYQLFLSTLKGITVIKETDDTGKETRTFTKLMRRLRRNILEREKKKVRTEKKLADSINVTSITNEMLKKSCRLTTTHRTRSLLLKMWHDNKIIRPVKFRAWLSHIKDDFGTYKQQDPHEFLILLLDAIHEEIKTRSIVRIWDATVTEGALELLRRRKGAIDIVNNISIPKEKRDKEHQEYEEYRLAHPEDEMLLRAFAFYKEHIKDSYSVIRQLFGGIYLSQIQCKECDYISGSF